MRQSDLKHETSRSLLKSGIETKNTERICCALIGIMTIEMFDSGMKEEEVILEMKKVRDYFSEMTEVFIATLK